jgi:hypothetical protein
VFLLLCVLNKARFCGCGAYTWCYDTFGVTIHFRFYVKTDVFCVCEGDKDKTSVDMKHNKHRSFVLSSKQDNMFENIKQELP